MPIILIGNSYKYEIEATMKLFFSTARYSFGTSREEAVGDEYVIAETDGDKLRVEVKLCGEAPEIREAVVDETQTMEIELCRVLFHILSDKTGIVPPWGLMTGIRPVKKVVELIREDIPKEEIFR
jgi:oxygen-independent coproporphyrinogen-3 oxidase